MLSSLQQPGLDLEQTPRKKPVVGVATFIPAPITTNRCAPWDWRCGQTCCATPLTASQLGEYSPVAHTRLVAAAKLRFKIRGGGWGLVPSASIQL